MYSSSQGPGPYSCEILFDDWENIDKVLHDKDLHIKFCKEVYPAGPIDRKRRYEIIPTSDDPVFHLPAVRLIFLTTSKTLYDNAYRTIGIDYCQKYWYMFSYKDLMDAKKKDIRRCTWLYRFKKHLKSRAHADSGIFDAINDKAWWKSRSKSLKDEDSWNDVFGVRLSPNFDSSIKNMSDFRRSLL